MVLISSKKYACETCIKGHRSSSCKHTDRPLFEIKKKGRPVTQCEHCRELRKTKQVHVKCICGVKDSSPPQLSIPKKGFSKGLGMATFPNGLPQPFETSATNPGEMPEHHGPPFEVMPSCCCLSDAECHCWTPRTSPNRSRRNGSLVLSSPVTAETPHVLARMAGYRPVLPRPASGSHESVPISTHGPIHHPHSHLLYSPYGRAYESHTYSHSPDSSVYPPLLAQALNGVVDSGPNANSPAGLNVQPVADCSCSGDCHCHPSGFSAHGFYPSCPDTDKCLPLRDPSAKEASFAANIGDAIQNEWSLYEKPVNSFIPPVVGYGVMDLHSAHEVADFVGTTDLMMSDMTTDYFGPFDASSRTSSLSSGSAEDISELIGDVFHAGFLSGTPPDGPELDSTFGFAF